MMYNYVFKCPPWPLYRAYLWCILCSRLKEMSSVYPHVFVCACMFYLFFPPLISIKVLVVSAQISIDGT